MNIGQKQTVTKEEVYKLVGKNSEDYKALHRGFNVSVVKKGMLCWLSSKGGIGQYQLERRK